MYVVILQIAMFVGLMLLQFGIVGALPAPWHTLLVPVLLASWWVRSRWYAFEHIGWWPLIVGITADVMSPYPFGTMTVAYLALAWTVRLFCIRLIPRLSLSAYTLVAISGLLAFAGMWIGMNTVRSTQPWREALQLYGSHAIPMIVYTLLGSVIVFLVSQQFGAFDRVRRA